jgi:hypothetical protein
MKLLIVCLLIGAGVCAAEDLKVTIASKDVPALVLTVPQTAKVTTAHGMTEIHTPNMILCVWPIPAVKSVDEGITQLPDVIKREVLKFVAATTNVITVAGAPAKHLIGRGIEADDNDPATADIVIFTTGKAVFAACVHGEGNQAGEEREPMLAVLKTAKAP